MTGNIVFGYFGPGISRGKPASLCHKEALVVFTQPAQKVWFMKLCMYS